MSRRRPLAALAALAAGLALAGCSSAGPSFAEKLFPLARDYVLGPEEAPIPPVPTREALNQIPFAMISIYRANDPRRAFVVPVADLDGYLVYQDQTGQAVVLRGGQIAATQGFGFNLSGVTHHEDDPIVSPTPVANWPAVVVRNYQFPALSAEDFEITVTCTYAPVARERIEIVEIGFELMRVAETCTNARRSFTNTYWVDPASGFIWKSEQWIGPRRTPLIVEVIRPYAPA